MKLVITSWEVLGEKLAEHSLHRTYCDRCGGHFAKDHALQMVAKDYAIRLN